MKQSKGIKIKEVIINSTEIHGILRDGETINIDMEPGGSLDHLFNEELDNNYVYVGPDGERVYYDIYYDDGRMLYTRISAKLNEDYIKKLGFHLFDNFNGIVREICDRVENYILDRIEYKTRYSVTTYMNIEVPYVGIVYEDLNGDEITIEPDEDSNIDFYDDSWLDVLLRIIISDPQTQITMYNNYMNYIHNKKTHLKPGFEVCDKCKGMGVEMYGYRVTAIAPQMALQEKTLNLIDTVFTKKANKILERNKNISDIELIEKLSPAVIKYIDVIINHEKMNQLVDVKGPICPTCLGTGVVTWVDHIMKK